MHKITHPSSDQSLPPSSQHPHRDVLGFWKLLLSWAIAIGFVVFIHSYVFQPFQVFGRSMEPTLHEGDYLIISKLGQSISKLQSEPYTPNRGDIVVINPDGTRLIKRVIGLPEERVVVSNGKITIINKDKPQGFNPYKELGLPEVPASGDIVTHVPKGHVYVVGDNRENGHSMDSRNQLGTVPTKNILGTLLARLWPPKGLRFF